MKKINLFFAILLMAISIQSFAQTTPAPAPVTASAFFDGNWDVLIAGTPNGDVKLIMKLERKDGKLTGSMIDAATKAEVAPLTKVVEEATAVTVDFSAQGYDLSLKLDKKDDDNLTGSLMGMFETKAVRIKEGK